MEMFIQKYWMVLIGLILMAMSMIWEIFRVSKETGKRYDIYQNLKSRVEQGTIEVDELYNLGRDQICEGDKCYLLRLMIKKLKEKSE